MNEIFEIAGSSVIGREHRLAGRNNQDASCWFVTDNLVIALVCDGCGSSQHSEVGARLGARLVAETISKNASQLTSQKALTKNDFSDFLERVRQEVSAHLSVLAIAMGGDFQQTINDYFLFTVLGIIMTTSITAVFSLGDGVYWNNGQVFEIGPFENNEPSYLAYGLVNSSLGLPPEFLRFQVHNILPTDEVQSLLIATDGIHDFIGAIDKKMPGKEELVGSVSQFWKEDGYFENQDKIRRKLFLANRDVIHYDHKERQLVRGNGLLKDDTTVVVIRRERKDPEINQEDPSTSSGSRR